MGAINWNRVIYNENEQKLIFSDQDWPTIPEAIINLYHNRVQHLDLSFNNLSSLNGLGLFSNLEELILDNNHFNDLIKFPNNLKNLKILSLNNNKIESLDILLMKLSASFPNLEYLSLLFNPVCPNQLINTKNNEADYQSYRNRVIKTLHHLKFLDSTMVTRYERYYYDKELQQKQIQKQRDKFTQLTKVWYERIKIRETDSEYTPLPLSNIREPGNHQGAYGKCKYKYIGTQSEGNRFICNNDL